MFSSVSTGAEVELLDPDQVPADPRLCLTRGPVFDFVQKDVPVSFTATVRNGEGHLMPTGAREMLEMKVTCSEKAARDAGRDVNSAAYPMSVSDDVNGSFECSFTPQVSGLVDMHVLLNGVHVNGSPFQLDVKPSVYVPLRFVTISDDSVKLDASRITATNESEDVFEYEDVTAGGPLPRDRPAWWKMRIRKLEEGLIGLIGDGSDPLDKGYSWQSPSAYMFETSQSSQTGGG